MFLSKFVLHRHEENLPVSAETNLMFDCIPDEGASHEDLAIGVSYELKAGVHFYDCIDLSEDISEEQIGKVPSHCQHVFGSLSKMCSMPALFLHTDSRIVQIWFEFFKLGGEGTKIPVYMRLSNRIQRLRRLNKNVEDVKALYTALGRELFHAYDIQFYLKFKAHCMLKNGFSKGKANVWSFDKFPITDKSYKTWIRNQGDPKFLDKRANHTVCTWQNMRNLAFGMHDDNVNNACSRLPSVQLANQVVTMIDLICRWLYQNKENDETFKHDVWTVDYFFNHVFSNMAEIRTRQNFDDNSSFLMWKLDPDGRIRLGKEMKAIFLSDSPGSFMDGHDNMADSRHEVRPIQTIDHFVCQPRSSFMDSPDFFFEILKNMFSLKCHIGCVIANRLNLVARGASLNLLKSSVYIPPQSSIVQKNSVVNFGFIFDSPKSIVNMVKNSKKNMMHNIDLFNAVDSNRANWSRLNNKTTVFATTGEDSHAMRNFLGAKDHKNIFVNAACGLMSNDFLLFLMIEKTWCNENCRKIVERSRQELNVKKRYQIR